MEEKFTTIKQEDFSDTDYSVKIDVTNLSPYYLCPDCGDRFPEEVDGCGFKLTAPNK